MRFIEYGRKNKNVIVFVHGSCTTAETCYSEIIKVLRKKYCCVLCRLDGHDTNRKSDFVSIERETLKIENYVKGRFDGKILAFVGLSLGSAICVNIMSRGEVKAEKIFLDSVYCIDKGFWYAWLTYLTCYAGIFYIRNGGRVPEKITEKFFGKGNRSVTDMLYSGISSKSVKNICLDVYRYKIRANVSLCESEILCIRGGYDPVSAQSVDLLRMYLPDLKEKVIENCGHAQFLNEHVQEYILMLDDFLKK